jgi:hypothetical protein
VTELALTNQANLVRTLKDQIAPDASDSELVYFSEVCKRLDLSPFKDEIALIGRYNKQLRRKVHRPQIEVAGRRVLAARTGELQGIEGPYWCGPRQFDEDGNKLPLEWEDVWMDDDTFPYAARCLVYRKGWLRPANGTTKWTEFSQWEHVDNVDRLGFLWKKMPSHMLGKTAESLALRRAFSDVIPSDVGDQGDGDTDLAHLDHTELGSGPATPGEGSTDPEPPPAIPKPAPLDATARRAARMAEAASRSGRQPGPLPVPPPARPNLSDQEISYWLNEGWTVDQNGEWHAP